MKKGITKREREVTDINEIKEILDKSMIVHVGMIDGDEPYVVPMNYGYTMENGKLVLYLHSAVRGKKLEMIKENPRVFFSIDCDRKPFEGKVACQYGTTYASVMGLGKAEVLETPEEKIDGLVKFMKTQTGKDFAFDEKLVSIVSVIKITAKDFTAKKRPLPMGIK